MYCRKCKVVPEDGWEKTKRVLSSIPLLFISTEVAENVHILPNNKTFCNLLFFRKQKFYENQVGEPNLAGFQ